MVTTVYLASSFSLLDRVHMVEKALTDRGYEIARRWWEDPLHEGDDREAPEGFYERDDVQNMAHNNYAAAERADVLVLVAPAPEAGPRKFNGANLEAGVAHALGIPVVLFGAVEETCMYAPFDHVDDLPELLDHLKTIAPADGADPLEKCPDCGIPVLPVGSDETGYVVDCDMCSYRATAATDSDTGEVLSLDIVPVRQSDAFEREWEYAHHGGGTVDPADVVEDLVKRNSGGI